MNEDFHKPFLQSLLIVAITTVVFMVSSHYMINYYGKISLNPIIYTSSSPASQGE